MVIQLAAEGAEEIDRAVRRARVRSGEGTRVGQFGPEELAALGRRGRWVVDLERTGQEGDGVVVAVGMFSDVERGQVEADRSRQPPDPGQPARCQELPLVGAERAIHDGQVVEELGGGAVGVLPAVPSLNETLVGDRAHLPVGLGRDGGSDHACVWAPDLLQMLEQLFAHPMNGAADAQLIGQHLDLADEDGECPSALESEHGRGGLRGDERVAVPIAAHP